MDGNKVEVEVEVGKAALEEQPQEIEDTITELCRKNQEYEVLDGDKIGAEDVQMEDQRKEEEYVKPINYEYRGKDPEVIELYNTDEDGESDSTTFLDDLGSGQTSTSDDGDCDDETDSEAPLTDAEVEELVAEFLEVESKAAEAQESLEKESLAKVESDVRAELAETLHGDELEKAVTTEMETFREYWETTLDDLETQGTLLLEQLDGSGIELPSLYRWIESQVPNGCCTEAWKTRAHWVGSQVSTEVNQSVREAEAYLQSCRPVRRQHGKLLEEGASGYLARKLSVENTDSLAQTSDKDWSSFNSLIQSNSSESSSFGSKKWASVYLASTPQQAANLGLKLPGIDEVEEIGEIDSNSCDPFFADAIANEKEIDLSEEQKKNFKKVKEEDDVNFTKKLQQHLKRRRQRNKNYEPVGKEILDGMVASNECSQSFSRNPVLSENGVNNFDYGGISDKISNSDMENVKTENAFVSSICKRSRDDEDVEIANKRSKTVVIESDDEVLVLEDKSTSIVPYRNQGSPPQNKKVIDIIDVEKLTSPCGKFTYRNDEYKDYYCTSCSGLLTASEVQKHPVLGVIVCKSCKILVEEKKTSKDYSSDAYCVWCGWGLELIKCKSCDMQFCVICLAKNFGDQGLSDAKGSGWQCCCCSPMLLQHLTLEFEKAVRCVPHACSDSEAEILDALIDGPNSDKKRLKKRIRRILDDAELGDETKRKIAVEKARQEHLKSMHEQSVGKSRVTHITAIKGNSRDGATDAAEGYIVNIAREGNEEIVRIPSSISSKLKPHQVAGIRFMWENVIQSVGKAKSGDKGLGCILAHTMGLGKTFQVIAFLYVALRGVDLGLKTALVVTPVNVLHNWRREFEKWRPHEYKRLRVIMLEDVARERRAELLAKWKSKGGVLLIGYAAFRNLSFGKYVKDKNAANEICHTLQYGPDVLVCDEAHMIKNTKADITQALKQVNTQRRIALTGSPLQNNLMEYYCMVDFVREGFLGSSLEFRNRFQNPIENGQHKNSTNADVKIMNQRSHILYEQLKGFVQRMGINVVKNDLPPKTVFVITVKLSPLQKKLYKKFLDAHGFTSDKVSSDKTLKRGCFFSGYQALAQISNHPGLLQMTKKNKYQQRREDAVENFVVEDCSSDDNVENTEPLYGEKQRTKTDLAKKSDILNNEEPDWWEDLLDEKIYKEVNYSGKMVLLLDILSMCSELGDKALVFSQSLTTLDLIEKYLSKLPQKGKEGYWKQGKDWYRLDGSTDGSERQNLVEKFNEPTNTRVKCTLISTRAGSLGINLHAANRVILVDGSWNPTYDLQAIFRVWRYGQNKPVYAYRLMAQKTMEEKVYKRQVSKEGLAARVVDRQQVFRTMSREEILHLFEFGEDDNPEMSEKIQEEPESSKQQTTIDDVGSSEIDSFLTPDRARSSDEILEKLLKRHCPGWIAKYHEHESLLQENEADRLTKEEQDMAWQTYQRSLIDWQEVHRTDLADHETKEAVNVVVPEGSSCVPRETKSSSRNHLIHRKSVSSVVQEGNEPQENKSSAKSHSLQRKCSNLNHLLTLRSKGTKSGGSTICGECSQEISWETLNKSK